MQYWHEVLPRRYGLIETFNHRYVLRHTSREFRTTLEIGAGLAEHLEYEDLTPEQERSYVALELRPNMVSEIRRKHPHIQVLRGDCQERLPFADGSFDRILAIHVLEHLPNLPAAIREMHRLCNPDHGVFSVVIPCEGSPPYALARRISAQRLFEKRYQQSYRWFSEREHLNRPREILAELAPYFVVRHRTFFPFPFLPWVLCNLCIGLTLVPRRARD